MTEPSAIVPPTKPRCSGKAGVANARQNGQRLGRSATASKHASEVVQLRYSGLSRSEIARASTSDEPRTPSGGLQLIFESSANSLRSSSNTVRSCSNSVRCHQNASPSPPRKQYKRRMRNAGRPESPCADCSRRRGETALAVHLRVVCAARDGNIGHAVVEQVFGSQLGMRMDQHTVGGLLLAGMTRDRVTALP